MKVVADCMDLGFRRVLNAKIQVWESSTSSMTEHLLYVWHSLGEEPTLNEICYHALYILMGHRH